VFRNQVRPLNSLGYAIAVFGTFLYSQATAAKKSKKIKGKKIGNFRRLILFDLIILVVHLAMLDF
jgi:hypothetical protein